MNSMLSFALVFSMVANMMLGLVAPLNHGLSFDPQPERSEMVQQIAEVRLDDEISSTNSLSRTEVITLTSTGFIPEVLTTTKSTTVQ